MSKKIFIAIVLALLIGLIIYFFYPGNNQKKTLQNDYTVAVINNGPALQDAVDGVLDGLKKLGYQEGQNLKLLTYSPIRTQDEARIAALDAIEKGADLITTYGIGTTYGAQQAAKEVSPDIPIVFVIVSDPVGNGVVESMNKPGANITGISPANETVSGRRLELLKLAYPEIKRVAFPYNNESTSGIIDLRRAGAELDIEILEHWVSSGKDAVTYIENFEFKNGDGILRASDSIIAPVFQSIITLANDRSIPIAGTNLNDTQKGALFSYGANYYELGEQAARLINKILTDNISPGNIPIELPTRFELSINTDTARMINLEFEDTFLRGVNTIVPQ